MSNEQFPFKQMPNRQRSIWQKPIKVLLHQDSSALSGIGLNSLSDTSVDGGLVRPNSYCLTRWFGLFVLLGLSLACSAGGLVQRAVDTPVPTRALVPTYTSTPANDQVLPQIIITPPHTGTPGVIILPEGMDPSVLILTLFPTPSPPDTLTPETTDLDATPPVDEGQPPLEQASPTAPVDGSVDQQTPAETPILLPSETPVPTETPIPPTPTPAPPTPYAEVESGLVSLRTGPSVEYPLVAQLGPHIPIAITGQSAEGTWYRLCCVNRDLNNGIDGFVWVVKNHVKTVNDASGVGLIFDVGEPPQPTPTWTFTPTPTITPTPTATPMPFDRYSGPQFFPTTNEFLTIWIKLFVGTPSVQTPEDPASGYYLRVLFEGFERPPTNGNVPSAPEFYGVSGTGDQRVNTGYSNLTYNLKYEYRPPDPKSFDPNSPNFTRTRTELIGTGTWQIYIVDGAGNQLSEKIEFMTDPTNPNREIYIAWQRVR